MKQNYSMKFLVTQGVNKYQSVQGKKKKELLILWNEEKLSSATTIDITLAIYVTVLPFICSYNCIAVLRGQGYYVFKKKEAEA